MLCRPASLRRSDAHFPRLLSAVVLLGGGGSLTFDLPCLDHADLEEQEMDAVGLQGAAESSLRQQVEDFPSELPDSVTLPPPDWPESLPEDDAPGAE